MPSKNSNNSSRAGEKIKIRRFQHSTKAEEKANGGERHASDKKKLSSVLRGNISFLVFSLNGININIILLLLWLCRFCGLHFQLTGRGRIYHLGVESEFLLFCTIFKKKLDILATFKSEYITDLTPQGKVMEVTNISLYHVLLRECIRYFVWVGRTVENTYLNIVLIIFIIFLTALTLFLCLLEPFNKRLSLGMNLLSQLLGNIFFGDLQQKFNIHQKQTLCSLCNLHFISKSRPTPNASATQEQI